MRFFQFIRTLLKDFAGNQEGMITREALFLMVGIIIVSAIISMLVFGPEATFNFLNKQKTSWPSA